MSFQVSLKTSDFRGDHSADVSVALNVDGNTTISELVTMVFIQGFQRDMPFDQGRRIGQKDTDHIEIRFALDINPLATEGEKA